MFISHYKYILGYISSYHCLQVAAMREIAHIADSFSTDRMDCRDKKLLDEVKNAVNECLMDVVGEARKIRRKGSSKRKRLDDLSNTDDLNVMQ